MFARLAARASAFRALSRAAPRVLLGGVAACGIATAVAWQTTGAVLAQSVASADDDADATPSAQPAASGYPVNMEITRMLPDRPPNLALRGVLIVTRHGSRTPISLLPGATKEEYQRLWGSCPLGDHTTIPCGRGALTHLGEFQLGSVGWHLRHRYVRTDGFLPERFDPSVFEFRSTDLPRTQLSLARMVQGLYPALPLETLAPLIEVRKQADETMYPNHYVCPRLKELYIEACHASRQNDAAAYPGAARYKTLAEQPDALALRTKFAELMKLQDGNDLGTWVVLSDELKCREAVGLPQVAGVTPAMTKRANELAEQTFWHILRAGESAEHDSLKPSCPNSSELLYRDKTPLEQEVVRLGMGRMMTEMFTSMDAIKDQHEGKTRPSILSPTASSVPRCLFYSGHDTTIAPLLAAFHSAHALTRPDSPTPGWPTLGGNMIVELLEVAPSTPSKHEESETGAKAAAAHRSLEESLAPLPPSATQDEKRPLPKQPVTAPSLMEQAKKQQQPQQPKASAEPAEARTKDGFSPHGSGPKSSLLPPTDAPRQPRIVNREPLVASPQSRWFLRLLVDHKEVSIIPYDEYKHVRDVYRVRDWAQECQRKTEGELPQHTW